VHHQLPVRLGGFLSHRNRLHVLLGLLGLLGLRQRRQWRQRRRRGLLVVMLRARQAPCDA
jgi:hypothetical protein